MKILNKITMRSLTLNKSRTFSTLFAILLSTALLCAITCFVASFQATFSNQALELYGNYHVTFFNLPLSNRSEIANSSDVSHYYLSKGIGYSRLQDDAGKQFLYLMEMDSHSLTNNGITLIKGRYPKTNREIMISEQFLLEKNLTLTVGDTLDLSVESMIMKDGIVDQNFPYSDHLAQMLGIYSEPLFAKTYTIVGIMENPNELLQPVTSAGYTVISHMDYVSESANFSVKFNNAANVNSLVEEWTNRYKVTSTLNSKLLGMFGSSDNPILGLIYVVAAFIVFVIISSCYFVISSSFGMSLAERVKQYSILSCIGTTKKQIRKMVLLEGFILSFVGIVAGIVLGLLLYFLFALLLVNVFFVELTYTISLPGMLLSSLLILITVFISTISVAIKASKIQPIVGALGSQGSAKIDVQKPPKWIRSYFGTSGVLAYQNIKRNASKFKATTISLTISIIIFISVSSFVQYSLKTAQENYQNLRHNVYVTNTQMMANSKEKYNSLLNLSKLNEINEFSILRGTQVYFNFSKNITLKWEEGDPLYNPNLFSTHVNSFGKEEYQRFVTSIGKTVEQCKDGIIYIANNNTVISRGNKREHLLNLKEGEIIKGDSGSTGKQLTFEIKAVTDKTPLGMETTSSYYGAFVISDELLEKIDPDNYSTHAIFINASNPSQVAAQIVRTSGAYRVANLVQEQKDDAQLLLIISTFLYGFVFIIALIGLLNIFNTLVNNLNLRAKEFAVLKSMGMTKKDLKKMINLESVFYCINALIVGILFGILISYLIYFTLKNMTNMIYLFPGLAIIFSIVFVILSVRMIIGHSIKKITSQNIIETIKNDNI